MKIVLSLRFTLPSLPPLSPQWHPEIQHYAPTTPFIIVGTKSDLREDMDVVMQLKENGEVPKTPEDGKALADELEAAGYLECSALTQEGLKDVFDEAIRCAIKHQKPPAPKKKKCVLF